jgi:hypothetical protein
MSKEKIQVTIAPKSLAGFISSVIIRYRFNNRNQEPDEVVIPDEVSDLVPIKIVWPKDTATEELLYKYEKKIKELEGRAAEQQRTVDKLTLELKSAAD